MDVDGNSTQSDPRSTWFQKREEKGRKKEKKNKNIKKRGNKRLNEIG